MKMVRSLLLSLPLCFAAMVSAQDASACGGCVVPPDENSQVTGHRMIFAASKTQTTLYDQIEYSGAPESFAWFLPIKGQVDIGVSADALFAFLGQSSSVQVSPPPLNCPPAPSGCDYYDAAADGGSGAGGASSGGPENGVEIWNTEVVGAYETVQLKADTPNALQNWFVEHGYFVPADVSPVINAYQAEGFGFLAMKLQPGEGVNSMQPVRVTAPGGGMGLPLRMVAAGTGAITPITLFVVAEGRYETQNFPNLKFDPSPVVFHWDDYTSNYDLLIKGLFESSDGKGWLTQSSGKFDKNNLVSQIDQVIDFNPGQSGWGTADMSEIDHAHQDLDTLFAGMSEGTIWLTRMHAQLARSALANDLILQAEASQSEVSRFIQAKYSDGNTPPCPDYSWCSEDSNSGGEFFGIGGGDAPSDPVGGKGKCSVEQAGRSDGPATLFAGLGLAAAVTVLRRRRRNAK